MEVNEKLKHLSEEQIAEVVEIYQDKSIKISEIIEKYNIDVKPAGLLKILPPIETEEICEICGENMFKKLEPRTSYSFSQSYDEFCLNCGHQKFANTGWHKQICNCEGCKKKRILEYERKKNLVQSVYKIEKENIEFEELTFQDQVKLIYLLFNNSYHNISQIAPMSEKDSWIECLNRMKEIGAISVSAESDIEAFCKEDFPYKYYVSKVIYDVNVHIEEKILSQINKNRHFIENSDEEELLYWLKKYMYRDLIQKFEEMLETRHLQLHVSEKANEKFVELLDKISYTQVLALCNRVAVFFSDKVLIGEMTKSVAKNAALLNVSKFYERAVELEWTLNHSDIDYIGEELEFFVTRVLNKDISILKDVANIDNFNSWKTRDNDYSNRIGCTR